MLYFKNRLILVMFMLTTVFGNCFSQEEAKMQPNLELKILSWNIYMLPHMVIHSGQRQRAAEIAKTLLDEEVDVIVFEEAFDKPSRKIIWEGLRSKFPYQSGDPAREVFYKGNSGIWVLSKTPLLVVKQIFFNSAKGADRFASKGALMLQTRKNNICYQVVATHLQSDLRGKNVRDIRERQYAQIRHQLLAPYSQQGIPQFVVGDMNTMSNDSTHYKEMINVLEARPCQLEGELSYSYDHTKNDIIENKSEQPQLIDHILYRNMDPKKIKGKMLVKKFQKKWSKLHSDLSDHFAVLGTFVLPVKFF